MGHGVVLGFTAGASEAERQRVPKLFDAAGVVIGRVFVHEIPLEPAAPLAPATLEIELSNEDAREVLGPVGEALSAVRSELPGLGLLLAIEKGGRKTWFSWRRDQPAEMVKEGAAALPGMVASSGSFGWDSVSKAWVRA